jgi:hypothetical protein
MKNRILFGMLLIFTPVAWSGEPYPGLVVDVNRDGNLYALTASFDSPLSQCASYQYLTDYEAAKKLPGVVESVAFRQSNNKVRVERTVDEHVLLFHVRLHSTLEYTEDPMFGISFIQLSGDSKSFQGNWQIIPNRGGSTLKFEGLWEPDTLLPLFVIDHFAKHDLADRFSAVARLAEARSALTPSICLN